MRDVNYCHLDSGMEFLNQREVVELVAPFLNNLLIVSSDNLMADLCKK